MFKSIAVLSLLSPVSADRVVVNARGDIEEESGVPFSSLQELMSKSGAEPEQEPQTEADDRKVTEDEADELAFNSTAQAIVDMQNQEQMFTQMDFYLRLLESQLRRIQIRMEQNQAMYAMLSLHDQLVASANDKMMILTQLIEERTDIEKRLFSQFKELWANAVEMGKLYGVAQFDGVIPTAYDNYKVFKSIMEQMMGPFVHPDTIYDHFGLSARTLKGNVNQVFSESFHACTRTEGIADQKAGKSCVMKRLQDWLENGDAQISPGQMDAISQAMFQGM